MSAIIIAVSFILVALPNAGNQADNCKCVYPWPPECNKVCSVWLGIWKLDDAKSKLGPGTPKNSTVVYEAKGDKVEIAIDGTTSEGKPKHSEWTGKFDGKDYPVIGDPSADAWSIKKIDDHTLEFTVKKADKTTVTGRIMVSADGNTRTVVSKRTDPSGKMFIASAVYDKQ